MELEKIEILLEKYFDAETSTAEEQELKKYFSGSDVAPHLEQYAALFGYFNHQIDENKFDKELELKVKRNYTKWLSIAASVVLLAGTFTWYTVNEKPVQHKELGTYNDPEVAFKETQKALNLLSQNVNVGVSSMNYIGEYEKTKEKVFKE